MNVILDSSAMLAFLLEEEGADVVDTALNDPNTACLAHGLNLCEVYYIIRRDQGEEAALRETQSLLDAGLLCREDLDDALRRDAGRLKADYRRVSLADCCGVALARRLAGTFYTSDHTELDPLGRAGECRMRFIR